MWPRAAIDSEVVVRPDIHPEFGDTQVTCSCGNTFVTRSTQLGQMSVELCNECHPFYTGKQKLVDSGGRVERFQRRYGRTTFTSDEAQPPGHAAAESTPPPLDAEQAAEAPADA